MTDTTSRTLDPAIQSFYERTAEEDRLQIGVSQLEGLRTRTLIEQYAPPPPAMVLDIGGAAGVYSSWLAQKGYRVHLIDPVERLVNEARRRSAQVSQPIASFEIGDARVLKQPADFADIVLLLGPLYHLTSADDRIRALAEAARVLKPDGVLFVAAISRWAAALDGLTRDLFADPEYTSLIEQGWHDGQHRRGDRPYFTTAFFHRPDGLRAEIEQAGLVVDGIHGLEGPGGMLSDFVERWADARKRADMIRLADALGEEPFLLGASAHLLVVARRVGGMPRTTTTPSRRGRFEHGELLAPPQAAPRGARAGRVLPSRRSGNRQGAAAAR